MFFHCLKLYLVSLCFWHSFLSILKKVVVKCTFCICLLRPGVSNRLGECQGLLECRAPEAGLCGPGAGWPGRRCGQVGLVLVHLLKQKTPVGGLVCQALGSEYVRVHKAD